MHKKLIKKMIESGKKEDMEFLEESLEELICDLKYEDEDKYNKIEMEMYEKVYGKHIDEELAKKWVSEMKNKDGSTSAHWTYEQTSQHANGHNKWDYYVVANMMYSDHYNPKFDDSTYLQLANDWLDDKDVDKDKLIKYYFYIVGH